MKKLLTIALMTVATLTASAQEIALTNGVYEKKEVITADGTNAGTLYVRALEALSDWAGSQQRSKANVDVQDKDEGLVVYKGLLYLGFHKLSVYGWETFANFTVKVRVKDGRAQIAVTVPSITYYWSYDNDSATVPLADLTPEFKYKGNWKIKKATAKLLPGMPAAVDSMIKTIGDQIKQGKDDDF